METPQREQSALSATARAEELLDRTGQRMAIFALQARQRLQETVSSIRTEADRMDQPSQQEEGRAEAHDRAAQADQISATTDQRAAPADQKTPLNNASGTTRAEGLVDNWTQRIGATAFVSSLQVQRFMARMREETEDIWAEAQDIQGRRGERQSQRESGQVEAHEREAPTERKTRVRKGDAAQGQHRKRGGQRERGSEEISQAQVEHRGK